MTEGEVLDLFGEGGDGKPTRVEIRVDVDGGGTPPTAPPAPQPTSVAGGDPPPVRGRSRNRAEPEVLSVSQVNRAVRALMEREIPPLWVSGEVANWTRARSGHCYFTLKDDQAQLRSVIWRREALRLPLDLEDGMRVRCFGSLTLYEARGEFQFAVREVAGEEGEGLWRLAFERLRRALEEEGLLDPARKRPIPRFPRTVGVVTSATGAALRDILSVIRRRAPWTRVLVRGARVQGEGAAEDVARAIRVLASTGIPDVLIVGRGGGSIEDLWAFNEEVVARAIVACPVPVISAVGHEVDVTIADLVADLRAPTPSAGAEAAVQDADALLEVLRRIRPRLARGLRRGVEARRVLVATRGDRLRRSATRFTAPGRMKLERQQERLGRAMAGLVPPRRASLLRIEDALVRGARGKTPPLRDRTGRLGERLEQVLGRSLERGRGELSSLAARIEGLSPLGTLRRGFAVPLDPAGGLIRSVDALPAGRSFELRLVDGRVACESLGPVDDEAKP